MDLTVATRMPTNAKAAFNGIQKTGAFEVPGCLARKWLQGPTNPDGSDNRGVLRPYWNGLDLTRRTRDQWIIDFGWSMDESEAALFEQPFQHLVEHVKPVRATNALEALRRDWWRFWRPRQEMRRSIADLPRYIVTPEVSKHRLFAWLRLPTLPDKNLIVIARSDDTTFGILNSRFHEVWALRMGTSLEDRPRYTPTTTFETFPFPEGLTPADTAGLTEPQDSGVILPSVADSRRGAAQAIAEAAYRLNVLRENWLNPPEWVNRIPEVVRGYPDRIIPKPEHAAEIKKRTLTNLYNARPTWLDNAHKALDAAVADAYGWEDYTPSMADEEILRRLLTLNLDRS
jgi:hypothetical protein